ncbi:TetR/AcrR family transcriptional regulator [Mycobacterium scrofulaceum]|uniref:TetR family transcriptional regulator n=1 Tax=Mycobacterium scrofulaceum TaxID=1783 RepID=A0A1X0KK23_MYCSC|nr:TetR/AcrR family transcriptional regulator [Mycobacterium scrofulaceum]ORB75472.1 TetR family transcriptional regulator [Mycobacterium scrofulaceum]
MPKVTPEYRAERRAHIMAAARRCFIRNGFHVTSMHDLVEEAGMSSGAVYRYFPSKDAVIEAIAAENLEQVIAVIGQSIDDGATPQAAIATVLDFVTHRHGEDGFAAIAVLVWSEALRNTTLAAHLREAISTAFAKLSADAARRSEAVLDPTAVADLLLCVLPGYLMRLAVGGPKTVENIPTTLEKVLDLPKRKTASA